MSVLFRLAAQFSATEMTDEPAGPGLTPVSWNWTQAELTYRNPAWPGLVVCGVENPAGTSMLMVPCMGLAGLV